MHGTILPLPNMPSRCGAQLKHRGNFKKERVDTDTRGELMGGYRRMEKTLL
jgi:hypothetical protein